MMNSKTPSTGRRCRMDSYQTLALAFVIGGLWILVWAVVETARHNIARRYGREDSRHD